MVKDTIHAIGDASVIRIGELSATFPAGKLLPGWKDGDGASGMTQDERRSGELDISVHAWLLRVGAHVILVDAGVGNGKRRALPLFDDLHTPFLDRLADAGARPEDITHVLLTHLHTDHVGWLTTERDGHWVPTFPNARTTMPQAGYDWFTSEAGRQQPNHDMFLDSVRPVVKAGNVGFVPAEGGPVLDGFSYHPTPGHSLDHMSISLRSAGQLAMFPGDVLHHPVQVAQPELCSMFCADPDRARTSRLWALETAAQDGSTWFSSHFSGPSLGRIGRSADGYRWDPA